jgi:signal transduction histidine kinase
LDTKRFYVIDDNPDDRALVVRTLYRSVPDIQVLELNSLEELDRALERAEPYIVVTDYMLQWSTGLEVLRRVKAVCPDCPVIMFTDSGNEDVVAEGLREGLDDYIRKKPGSYRNLENAVFRAMRRHTELEQLRAAEVMQSRAVNSLVRAEKLAAAGRLASSIAHEINNPLEAVMNLLFLAQSDKQMPRESRSLLDEALKELGRVAHIARQALAFYRDPNRPQELDLEQQTKSIIELYHPRIAAKQVSIAMDTRGEAVVLGYGGELRQVISNLIINAVDACGDGGRIVIRIRNQMRSAVQPSGVTFTICDNGHGIQPELREQLFEPFVSTKGERGTGLGLWVTQGIVNKHGGSIRLRTCTEEGRSYTCFRLFLHRSFAPLEEQAKAAASQMQA